MKNFEVKEVKEVREVKDNSLASEHFADVAAACSNVSNFFNSSNFLTSKKRNN
jgi:hypothetical protein